MSKALDSQRTYALIGTGGCGKTSLAEMLLFQSGVINRLGAIEEGTTTLDYEPEEIKRRGSIQPGFATFLWNKDRHFLMDVPGDTNFTGDLPYLLMGVDAAVVVIDAVDGVRPLTRRIWNAARDAGLPSIVFINKMDRDRADFDMAYNGLSAVLGMKPVTLYMPIRDGEAFTGLVDILGGKALMFGDNGAVSDALIPEALMDEATLLRDTTIENIAESDEELMEKYLEEGSLSPEDLSAGLRKGVLNGSLTPVVVGSSLENKGGSQLLDAIVRLFPSPLERAPYLDAEGNERVSDDEGAPCCFVFKTIADPFSGQLNMVRVVSGTISSDSTLKNMRTEEPERLGTLLYLDGKTQTPCKDVLGPGAIIAVGKLKNTRTGDTLCDDKAPFAVAMPQLAPQLITFALAPKEKGEEDKVYAAVQKLLDEDATLKLGRDEESGDILLSGMGQLHIETSVERAKRRYKVEILLKTPKVPYRETVRGKVQAQGRHKKQSGGRGQFGDCWIEMEGLPRGSGYVFEDAIVGGAIPRNYIPAIDKGIQETAARGFLAGCPVVDFKVRLYDGSYHTVDSSEMAFKVAGSLAFKKAMESLKAVLLEPIVLLSVSVPDEYMGDVIGDLSSRRGKVLGSDSQAGITEIKAHIPMSEVLRYAPELRSITGGQGVFTMEFDHYEEAPQPIVDKVVAEHQKAKAEE
ncbi:MAG TPA: elongation factor G [Candidatus Bilophila faecipullorum]|uniref:Elongation factor G n=1 Tax=Candidatus Bilophila faecipullorum TaxID=2838482 RepID=A0A9D1U872_9BACT|nr:elongation factor G [uncultured Bilophila sp.]HIW78314.1 elongation factor G [Candidatus Bilophila faecipullorum]